MKRTASVIVVVALPFLVGAVGPACGGGRATSDASTAGKGGGTGSAGMGGGAGDGAGGIDGGAGGATSTAGTGGGSGTSGRGGTSGGGTSGGGTSGGGTSGGAGSGGAGTGGGGGTVSGDAGTTPCGNNTCAADQICVRMVIGAASYVCPDAGHVTFPPNCDGRLTDANGCCYGAESDIYSCAARPSGCGATITCACASTLCTLGACLELAASNEVTCLGAGP